MPAETPSGDGFLDAASELAEDGAGTQPETTEIPAAQGSALASLRDRRQRVVEQLHFDLPVPRYDPPIFVRYRPVDFDRIERTHKRTAGLADKDHRARRTNALILAEACLGVFEVLNIDGRDVEVSVDPDDRDGTWPTFGPRLATLLGVPMAKKASDVVTALYATDGDLISTSEELARLSGYAQEHYERDSSGN